VHFQWEAGSQFVWGINRDGATIVGAEPQTLMPVKSNTFGASQKEKAVECREKHLSRSHATPTPQKSKYAFTLGLKVLELYKNTHFL